LGIFENFQKAMSLCEGDVILFSDQDVVWYPTKLQQVEEMFMRAPHAAVLLHNADLVDENLRDLEQTVWQKQRFKRKLQNMVLKRRSAEVMLKFHPAPLGMSLAFKSEYLEWCLPFPIGLGHGRWTMLLIAFISDIALISESLA
jgi:hypothetical protein